MSALDDLLGGQGQAAPRSALDDLTGVPPRSALDDLTGDTPPPIDHASVAERLLKGAGSVVGTVGRTLGAPQQALFEVVSAAQEGRTPHPLTHAAGTYAGTTAPITGEKLLETAGMGAGPLRWTAGLAADIAADPLNLLGVGAVQKGIKAATKASGIPKAIDAALMNPAVETIHSKFMRSTGPKELRNFMDLQQMAGRAKRHEAVVRATGPILPLLRKGGGQAERELIPYILEQGAQAVPNATPELLQAAKGYRDLLENQFASEVATGVMNPASKVVDKGYTPYLFSGPAGDVAKQSLFTPKPFAKAPPVRNVHTKGRTLNSFKQAVAAGAVPDIVEGAASRLSRGVHAEVGAETIRGAAGKWGVKVGAGGAVPDGYRVLDKIFQADLPIAKELQGVAFPEVVARNLERMVTRSDLTYGTTMELARAINQAWKTGTTTINPFFHATNAVGNVAQMVTVGEMNPLQVVPRLEQARLLRKLDPDLIATAKFGKYDAPSALALAQKFGVVGVEFGQFHSVQNSVKEILRQQGISIAPSIPGSVPRQILQTLAAPVHKGVAAMANLGGSVEDTSRLALFLDRLAKGEDGGTAALKVRDALFDYSSLPEGVKKVRDLWAPYITWYYKNLPAQVKLLATRPDLAMRGVKVKNALEEPDPSERITPAQMPEFAKERGMITSRLRGAEGEKQLVDPNLPIQDLESLAPMLAGDPIGVGKELSTYLGPIPKLIVEGISGRDLRTGRELWKPIRHIQDTEGNTIPTTTERAPAWAAELLTQFPALRPYLSAHKEVNPRTGEAQTRMDPVAAWFLRTSVPSTTNLVARTLQTIRGDAPEQAVQAGDIPVPHAFSRMSGQTFVGVSPEEAAANEERQRALINQLLYSVEASRARRVK